MIITEQINNIQLPYHGVLRYNEDTVKIQLQYIYNNLDRLVKLNNSTSNNEIVTKEIRIDIDDMLRRAHAIIKRRVGAHYVQVTTSKQQDVVFEHMIPNNVIRELLIASKISIEQACNMPTCLLSKQNDQLLSENGWHRKTPDIFNFWTRYDYCFNVKNEFETWDGVLIHPTMNLAEHFEYFEINTEKG